MIAALSDKDSRIRFQAAEVLTFLQPFSHIAAMSLEVALHDPDPKVRKQAMFTLGEFSSKGKRAVPALIKHLEDFSADPKREHEAIYAVNLLKHIGPDSKEALPLLRKLLKHKNLKFSIVLALGKIGPDDPTSNKVILNYLNNDEDRAMQEFAVRAIGLMGPPGKEAIPSLIKLLHVPGAKQGPKGSNTITVLRCSVAYALAEMGPEARPAIPELVKVLKNKNEIESIRNSTAVALGKLVPISKEAIPALIEVLIDPKCPIRQEVTKSIGSFGKEAVPHLIQVMKEGTPYERDKAMSVLPFIGAKDAQEAIPLLRAALKDISISSAARSALFHLGEPIE